MKQDTIVMFLILSLMSTFSVASELKTVDEKYSYALGYKIGSNIKNKFTDINKKTFLKGMNAAIKSQKSTMTESEMTQAMQDYHKNKKQVELKEATTFVATYKKRKDVKALSDGMYYRILKSGKGTSPKETSTVEVHYRGTLINGKEFDSSYKRGKPAQFPLNRVIKGWTIAVQKMKPGDKWEILIPPQLAYGTRGAPGGVIGPNATLLFEIELVKVL